MNKASVVEAALKSKAPAKVTKVAVTNTPTVKIAQDEHKPHRYPPHLNLSNVDLPAIDSWTVGKKYKLTLEVEMVGMRKRKAGMYEMVDEGGDAKSSAEFEVTKVSET
jgi:hypothetical protein